jgi:hypothetical protein
MGTNWPFEVRFSLNDAMEHYPRNLNQCGPGSEGISTQFDGYRYCSIRFNTLLDASANPDWKGILSGSRTIPYSMYESDNELLPAHMVEGSLSPNEWYVPDCMTYTITVWRTYLGNGRGVCYETDAGETLSLNIGRCSPTFFPFNDFYTFKFKVSSPNLPP